MTTYPESVKERARELAADGTPHKQVARALGVPYSTVFRWLNPAYAERQRLVSLALKEKYRGTCVDCGTRTAYSGRGSQGSERCQPCRVAYVHANKTWTQETVIDAIQRFTAANGRPPHANEWITADPANGYPAASTVHQANGWNPSAPFRYWADAIEAAGFERPRAGGYPRTAETRAAISASQRRRRARERAA